jgi:hypothetical protein
MTYQYLPSCCQRDRLVLLCLEVLLVYGVSGNPQWFKAKSIHLPVRFESAHDGTKWVAGLNHDICESRLMMRLLLFVQRGDVINAAHQYKRGKSGLTISYPAARSVHNCFGWPYGRGLSNDAFREQRISWPVLFDSGSIAELGLSGYCRRHIGRKWNWNDIFPVLSAKRDGMSDIFERDEQMQSRTLADGGIGIKDQWTRHLNIDRYPRSLRKYKLCLSSLGSTASSGRAVGDFRGLFLDLAQHPPVHPGKYKSDANPANLQVSSDPLPERLRWPISIFGAIVFAYFYWQARFNMNRPLWVWGLGCLFGFVVFNYGLYLLVNFGEYLYQ